MRSMRAQMQERRARRTLETVGVRRKEMWEADREIKGGSVDGAMGAIVQEE